MITLIIAVAFGILIATFAVQNRNFVDLRFGSYLLSGVPVYLLILGTILLTLILTGILYAVHALTSSFTLFGKNNALRREHHENEVLEEKVHDLEEENARLKEQRKVEVHRPVFSS